MAKISFIGKSLLIEDGKKRVRVLVIGDLHLGYEGSLREKGYGIPFGLYRQTIKDLDNIFEFVEKNVEKEETKGKVIDKIIFLGDLKHEFGSVLRGEWEEVLDLLDYLKKKCKEIVIVKGNHDVVTNLLTRRKEIEIVNYYLWKDFAFLHGDKDFEEIYDKKIKYWVIGHGHPAIGLKEKSGNKNERYKCFLIGKYKYKKIIVVPSFFEGSVGTDVEEGNLRFAWKFNLRDFDIKVVGEDGLSVLSFGKLRDLS